MHPSAAYWDKGIRNVPDMTGARLVLDGRDMREVMTRLGIDIPVGSLLDYGCGTGRLAQLAQSYMGLDIAPSAIDYCLSKGLSARLIEGPGDIPALTYDLIACISVCTHIDADERAQLLWAFGERCRHLLVDIIPGDGGGDIALWTADTAQFEELLTDCGWTVEGWTEYPWDASLQLTLHRYYRCSR